MARSVEPSSCEVLDNGESPCRDRDGLGRRGANPSAFDASTSQYNTNTNTNTNPNKE